jgi:hypothetical protein
MQLKYIFIILLMVHTLLIGDTEPNNSCFQAEVITIDELSTLDGILQASGQADASDYYKFVATSSGTLTVTLSVSKNTTAYLYGSLLGLCNPILPLDTDTSSTSITISTHITSGSTYYLHLHSNENGNNRYETTASTIPVVPPIVDYRLDECLWNGTAGEVKDSSSNLLHGTANNSATTAAGQIYNGGYFVEGEKQSVSIPPNNNLKISDAITFSAWIKRDSIDNRLQNIYTHGQWNNALRIQDNNKILFSLRLGGTNRELYSNQTITDTEWHHVAATYNGSVMMIYIDGGLDSSVSRSGTIATTNAFYTIGDEQLNGTYTFNGSIDEVKVWSDALSGTAVTRVYANENSAKNWDGTSRTAPCCCLPTGGNLIANPSFEIQCNSTILQTWNNVEGGTVHLRDGLCGWNVPYSMETWENTALKPASDGVIFTEIDGRSGEIDKISQTLNTVNGVSYVISFDYRKRDSSYSDVIIAKWNGIEVNRVEGTTDGWQTAQIQVTGTGSDILSFEEPSASDDSYGSWIDNIRLAEGTLETPHFAFDAWDSFRSISDRNISTKIVNKPFTLTVASLDQTNTVFQDFNGTVCAKLIDTAGNALTGWNTMLFNSAQSTTTFTLNRAIGGSDSAGVRLMWKKDADPTTACDALTDTNTTIASDRFAVRPASFALTAPNAVAGVSFDINITAPVHNNSTPSADYNETVGGSFDISVAEYTSGCPMGDFTPPLGIFGFINGAQTLTTLYDEVGILDINLTDLTKSCASRYANVDCDDANVSDGTAFSADLLPIGLTQEQITIIPHHFDVNATLANFNNGEFTYLSDDLNMSAQLDITVTAKNGEGSTTKNYNSECYAKIINNTITYATDPSYSASNLNYQETNTSISDHNNTATTFAMLNLPKSIFGTDDNGTAKLNVLINFDRDSKNPVSPFDLNISSVTVTDTDSVDGNDTTVGDAKFVYGRVRAYDIATNEASAPNPVEFEVYSTVSTGYVSGMPQNVLKWYRNLNHDSAAAGNVIQTRFDAAGSNVTVSTAPQAGVQIVTVISATNQTVHLDISPWLWYSPANNYDYNADCGKHPCFRYSNTGSSTGTSGVKSGTFQGSDFQMTPAKNTTKKGVKLFR